MWQDVIRRFGDSVIGFKSGKDLLRLTGFDELAMGLLSRCPLMIMFALVYLVHLSVREAGIYVSLFEQQPVVDHRQ